MSYSFLDKEAPKPTPLVVCDFSYVVPGVWVSADVVLDRSGVDAIVLQTLIRFGVAAPISTAFEAYLREKQYTLERVIYQNLPWDSYKVVNMWMYKDGPSLNLERKLLGEIETEFIRRKRTSAANTNF